MSRESEPHHRRTQRIAVRHAQRGTGLDQIFGHFGEVERVRPDDDRPRKRRGLEQIVAADRNETATDERDIGRRVEAQQLAHRIDDEALLGAIRVASSLRVAVRNPNALHAVASALKRSG